MRRVLGSVVLVLGIVGLGLWANANNARRIERIVTEGAEAAIGSTVHPVETSVSGRDILASGIADSAAEKAEILARLDAVTGRRVVVDAIEVLEPASPYVIEVEKTAPDALSARGNLPTAALGRELGLADVKLASGAPAGWADRLREGMAALAILSKGSLRLEDDKLSLSGEARGEEEMKLVDAILARMPAGSVSKNITLTATALPPQWSLDYTAGEGASIAGRLHKGLDIGTLAAALGLSGIAGAADHSEVEAGWDAGGKLAAVKAWLGQIERMRLEVTPEGETATVEVQGGVDAEAIHRAFAEAGIEAEVKNVVLEGQNGATRINAATGETQRFMGGFWLVPATIEPNLAACQAAADRALEGKTINFVTGSAELDASAVAVINDLARFMLVCAEKAGLKAEIGGHTDAVGDEAANLELSRQRAEAVRRELIRRGVSETVLAARGYGTSQPVADNATEEGRARNRRTTIVWSE